MLDRLLKFAGVCVLGIATTVTIAWIAAYPINLRAAPSLSAQRASETANYFSPHTGELWQCIVIDLAGMTEISARRVDDHMPMAELHMHPAHVPAWSTMRSGHADGAIPIGRVYIEHGVGWPLRTLAMRHWSDDFPRQWECDGLRLPEELRRFNQAGFLPARFIWPGAGVSVAMFSWAWFCMFMIPGMVRRAIRRTRGLCPGCGYDPSGLREPRCPECGRRLPP